MRLPHVPRAARVTVTAWLFILLSAHAPAQIATVRESVQVFRTYPFSDPDPVARMGNIYPYFRFQGYSRSPVDRPWRIVTLENAYIRVLVAPEMGGKILGAFEKSTGRPFIYFNRVIKFREIAMRGPWTSGGIEFNFGDIGHAPTTATPVDYVTRTNPDGSASCFVGALDLPSRTEWRVEIRLPADRALFETRAWWANPTELSTSFYHWTNAAADADSTLQVIYPGTAYIGHDGAHFAWPAGPGGRNLSWYRDNAFGSYKSYHVLGSYTDFFGARWGDFGVIHWSRYADKPGKKLWIWGLSREGEIWKDLLTDPALGNTQYVEIQSGLHFNQAMMQSSRTPFKHMEFPPASSERFTETWFPFKGAEGVTRATPDGVLYVQQSERNVRFVFCPTGEFRGDITVSVRGVTTTSRSVALRPLQALGDSVTLAGLHDPFEINVGGLIRYSSTDDSARVLSRPLDTERQFDWNTAYGLSVDARERARQRDYEGALTSYRMSLAKDPALLPALAGAAELFYRRMDYDSAFAYARRGLGIDAYDPASNYAYALAARRLGRVYDARDGFAVSSQSREYRSASLVQLAEIACAAGEWGDAAEFAGRCLAEDAENPAATRLGALVSRYMGDTATAVRMFDETVRREPLSHFSRCERYLLLPSEENRKAFTGLVRGELPQETYMELCAYYAGLGLWNDAEAVIRLAPGHPMALLWRAYVLSKLGRLTESGEFLGRALSASPEFIFPHRREEMAVLLWAESEQVHWKNKYYIALLCWSLGRTGEALRWLDSCGNVPDFAPFYITRASFREDSPARALADYRRALDLTPGEWRTHDAIISYLNRRALYADALPLSRDAARRFPGSYMMQFLLARTLLFNRDYTSSLSILDTLAILPFEGARYGRDAYRHACILASIQEETKGGPDSARSLIARARLWPERLGAGEPYDADARIEDYVEAMILRNSGDVKGSDKLLGKIVAYTAQHAYPHALGELVGAWALRDLGRNAEALGMLRRWIEREPENPRAAWSLMTFRNQRGGARALEEKLRSTLLNRSNGDQEFVLMIDVAGALYDK